MTYLADEYTVGFAPSVDGTTWLTHREIMRVAGPCLEKLRREQEQWAAKILNEGFDGEEEPSGF